MKTHAGLDSTVLWAECYFFKVVRHKKNGKKFYCLNDTALRDKSNEPFPAFVR